MMSEKRYVSDHNYNPGSTQLPAGTVFTEAQWVEFGGSVEGLAAHVSKGYIKEAVQTRPDDLPPMKPAVDVVEEKPSEEPEGEESAEEVVVTVEAEAEAEAEAPAKATGIWDFAKEELDPLPLDVLNSMYKDRCKKFEIKGARAYKDKDALIKKMTSENNQ
jgi:hypothetical protein